MKKLLFIIAIICISSMSFAVESSGPSFYIGAGGGNSVVDTGVTNLTGTASLDDEDSGLKLFGGLKFNKFIGIEASYINLGTATLTGNTGDGFTFDGVAYQFPSDGWNIEADATTIALEAMCFLPLDVITGNDSMKFFEPFIKIGMHFWDIEYSVSAAGIGDDDGTDFVFGTGINFNIIERLTARAEWQRFATEEDIDFFSASLIFNF